MPMDVFTPDVFGTFEMVAAIEKQPYRPGMISRLGLFQSEGVDNKLIAVEEKDGMLRLVPYQTRGGAASTLGLNRGVARSLTIPHAPLEDYIYPAEVAGVREFGQVGDIFATVERKRDELLNAHAASFDVTEEWHRLGCIKGEILDADGTTSVLDLFSFFGVTQEADTTFNLPSAAIGDIDDDISALRRTMMNNLKTGSITGMIGAICGDDFFDALKGHSGVRTAYTDWGNLMRAAQLPNQDGQPGDFLRENLAYEQFPYQRVMWMNYRGNDSLLANMVATGEAHFFPMGVPGLFITRYAPSERYLDTVNTIGRPRFSRAFEDPEGTYVKIYSEMNDIQLCTQPLVLMKGLIGT